jgi:predicted Zn-dependent protease
MIQPEWREQLEKAINKGEENWLAWLHLGVMRYQAKEPESARRAWEQSLAQAETPWALRNLAVLAMEDGQSDEAAQLYLSACRMRPSLLPLAVECGRALIDAGRPRDWLDLLADLPASIRAAGRICLLEARAALAVSDFKTVERILAEKPIVADMREGEESLSDLWLDYHARRLSAAENLPLDDALRARALREFPVPQMFDFRMKEE